MVEEVARSVERADPGALARPLTVADLDAVSVLALAADALTERATEVLADAGFDALRPAHARLFAQLIAGPRHVGALAQALEVTPQAISKTLAPLAAEGYVEVRPGEDSRTRVVTLADRGRRAVLAARAARAAVAAEHGPELARARAELLAVLERLGLLDAILRRERLP